MIALANTLPHRAPSTTGLWAAETQAELRRTMRLPQFTLPTILTPAAFYATFYVALAKDPTPEILAQGLLGYGVFAALGPALFGFGAGIAMEREQGVIELRRVSPMPPSAIIVAKLVAAVVMAAVAFALIALIGASAGARLSPMQWLGGTAVALLTTVPYALIGLAIGMRMTGKGAVAVANALFMGSAVLGGLWFPFAALPSWMQAAGYLFPSMHLGQLAHATIGAATVLSVSAHAAIIAGMTSLAAIWAWTGWRRGG